MPVLWLLHKVDTNPLPINLTRIPCAIFHISLNRLILALRQGSNERYRAIILMRCA